MAQRVEAFPEIPRPTKYPWDEWLDGAVWELVPGEDFKGRPAAFRSVALEQARRRGGRLTTRLLRAQNAREKDRLYLRFEPDGGHARGRAHSEATPAS